MSSHHIVRENQEPALLIANAHAISYEKVQELLEWMPTLVVVETEIETVLSWGIKVDVLIAPASRANDWELKLAYQFPIKIIPLDSGEESLETGFSFLLNTQAKAINCLLQTKDQLSKLELYSQVDIEAFVEGKRWSWIKSGKFEKWVAANTILHLYPEGRIIEVEEDGIFSITQDRGFWLGEALS
ncbi:MAG: hypothetical protein KBF45_02950 [Cyclobacteriaceae bacterium]|nr:hypothetical protein [Cyclobacteriaceae bacterium]